MLRYLFYNFVTPLLLFLVCFAVIGGFFTEQVIWGRLTSVVFGFITALYLFAKVLLSVFIEDNITSTLLAIAISTLLIRGSFKVQHWPGQNEILISGLITLALWFILFRKKT